MTRAARIATIVGLAVWTLWFARTPLSDDAMESFLHLPDLVFHEAGHIIFSPFGQFMTVLGGSLMQTLVPIVAAVAFIRQEDTFSAAVCAWWAGQNLVDLAPYVADAQKLQLVLLGGRTGAEVEGHDWEFIMTQLGLLHRAERAGYIFYGVGLVTMVAALVVASRTTIARESE